MSFTPFARYRNFTLANLKALLEVYPDMASYGNYTRAVSNVNARIVHCCKISDQRTEGST